MLNYDNEVLNYDKCHMSAVPISLRDSVYSRVPDDIIKNTPCTYGVA